MRFYSLGNYYLSSIQQGIQAGHALGEVVVKYEGQQQESAVVMEFLTNHKTWVLLNGGNFKDVYDFYVFMSMNKDSFRATIPYAPFNEDPESLEGMMTCVGLILPPEYYNAVLAKSVPDAALDDSYVSGDIQPEDFVVVSGDWEAGGEITHVWKAGTPDWQLIDLVKSCRLAT